MKMRLLIAIPSYETMRVEFVESLMALTDRLHHDGISHEVKILAGTLVHIARDKLARHAVNNGFTHVLWIDSDMVFEPSLVDDLMTSNKDMVCGLFISRHNPYLNVIFRKAYAGEIDRYKDGEIPQDTFQVAACGFGCVLMKAEILRNVLQSNHGTAFLPTPALGEDLAFCERARGCGYEIWCEPTARVGHIGSVVIWPEDGPRLRGDIQGLEGKVFD